MIQKISASISVNLIFNHNSRKVFPQTVIWEGRNYKVIKVGLHHTYREGRTLMHVFSVESRELFFRLVLNTDTLHWRLEEISDGEPD